MQQGSLIRSDRQRGPDVWQFRWADRGPYGKRIYRKTVIGTICQYPDADSARKSVTILLREINARFLQRWPLPMTGGRSLRSLDSTRIDEKQYLAKLLQAYKGQVGHSALGKACFSRK